MRLEELAVSGRTHRRRKEHPSTSRCRAVLGEETVMVISCPTTRHRPLAILRIVAAVLLVHAGVQVLFNVPASTFPPPPAEMATLMTIAGTLELVGGLLILARVPDPPGGVHPLRDDGGRLLGLSLSHQPLADEQSRRRSDPLLLHLLLSVLRRTRRVEHRRPSPSGAGNETRAEQPSVEAWRYQAHRRLTQVSSDLRRRRRS